MRLQLTHALQRLSYHIETIYLFTRSDYKTILLPVTVFSVSASSIFQARALVRTLIWTWLHLLQANVSNQTFSGHEDIVNKPWRPLPSGRVTVHQARGFRFFLMALCLGVSYFLGPKIAVASLALTAVEVLHDDVLMSHHPLLKNLCNVGGYLTFEIGATLSMTPTQELDGTAYTALTCSALLILTTITAQDFADVEGDKLSHRRTMPIIAPNGSRWVWGLDMYSGCGFLALGTLVGLRYFCFRDPRSDRSSYVLYNAKVKC
ncbi:hypothetical protein D9613_000280 [Agrocybe pediades]|uniref:Uncharacterized protein n=1 Tax=Agrocybe pediades TaxID=84607 RepID=A0A8H4VSS2_9AGAR|nr:hypothetical protein D9613_000280 [Agrocybe pediades]